jgi:Trypsin-like peptidase domain
MTARADQLSFSTLRIEAFGSNGSASIGTGFFMVLNEHGIYGATVVITNRHIVEGAHSIKTTLNCRIPGAQAPQVATRKEVVLSHAHERCLFHPDPDIDLAAFPIADVIDDIREHGDEPYFRAFSVSELAGQAKLDTLPAVTEVAIIGYPTELWDTQNSLPVKHRGITATPPYERFNEKSQFVIDGAWLPGSSGSPVVMFDAAPYSDKFNAILINRPSGILLGVLSGPVNNPQGPMTPHPTPATPLGIGSFSPTKLAYCVRAEEIHWFDEYLRRALASAKS